MSNVFVEEASLQDIANAIREKNGAETTYKPSEMGNAIRGIRSSENEWIRYADSIIFKNLDLFNVEELVLDLDNVNNLYCLFQQATNTKVKTIAINCPNEVSNAHFAFESSAEIPDTVLEKIILNCNTSKASRFDYMFSRKTKLKDISGQALNLSSATKINGMFTKTESLENVCFVKNSINIGISFIDSPLLSEYSIQSIVNGLATVETSQILTLHKDVKAKLTEEQLITITGKNWTLA